MKVSTWFIWVGAVVLMVGGAAAQNAPVETPVVVVGKPAADANVSTNVAARESVITAKRIEFDNKEGVILFDEDVLVDDPQFLMRSDRLLVFMEGTNDVQQIMAVGRVSITNANRTASCDKAVYTKKDGRIVMTGDARLKQQGKQAADVAGERITIWVDDERMEVVPGHVVLPPGTFNKSGMQKMLP